MEFILSYYYINNLDYLFMRNFFIPPFLFFVFPFFFAFAQVPTPQDSRPLVVATVNIQNATIIEQVDRSLTISFELNNREGAQGGVRYGVRLLSMSDQGVEQIDEKVYEEELFLAEHSSTHREVRYDVPSTLSGNFSVILVSTNEDGLPLGTVRVGEVTVESSGSGVLLRDCLLDVGGEDVRYRLEHGVDILPSESLLLVCQVVSSGAGEQSVVPHFETRRRTQYGETVTVEHGDVAPITLAQGSQFVAISLPLPSSPQAYSVGVSLLKDGEILSNTVFAHYVLRGVSATIQNLQLDRGEYLKGDTAQVSVLWSPSADSFPGARYSTTSKTAISYTLTLADKKGSPCALTLSDSLPNIAFFKIPLSVDRDCKGAQVTLVLHDALGRVLAERSFSDPGHEESFHRVFPWLIPLLLFVTVLVFILYFLFFRPKKGALDRVPE